MFAEPPEMDGPFEVRWETDPEQRRRYNRSRRKLGKPAKLGKLRDALALRQNWLCHYCNRRMSPCQQRIAGITVPDESATLEHLVPHAEGGKSTNENCRAVCHLCNCLKGRLDHAIRALERSMREGFMHETHYYADNVRRALTDWEERIR